MIEFERIEQPTLFDYAALDSETYASLQEQEAALDCVLKRTSEEIGVILLNVKKILPHGKYMPWLVSRGISESTAWRCIQVAQGKPIHKSFILKDLPVAMPAIQEPKQEFQQESITPRQFLDEVFPGFHQPAENKEQRDAHVMRVMGSSESNEWYTPQEIIERVTSCFGEIELDPCSNSHESPAVPARTIYTQDDDGLAHTWQGKTYLNPPFGGEIGAWVEKLVQEHECGNVEEAIALLPARIDTHWFQPLYAYPMCNVRGRIQYANSPYHAPFPCVVVYLGRTPGKFIATFADLGPIMGRIG